MPARSKEKDAAIALGLHVYETGKPCKRGHLATRFVGNQACTTCQRLATVAKLAVSPEAREASKGYSRKWSRKNYADNAEEMRAKHRKWRADNPEAAESSWKKSQAKRSEQNKKYNQQWQRSNPAKVTLKAQRRRARKAAASGSHTLADAAKIRCDQGDRCSYCHSRLLGKGHLDHIKALSKGGSDWPRNLQWLCIRCNSRKCAKDPVQFAREMGLLI